jgi:hypothetical protein
MVAADRMLSACVCTASSSFGRGAFIAAEQMATIAISKRELPLKRRE